MARYRQICDTVYTLQNPVCVLWVLKCVSLDFTVIRNRSLASIILNCSMNMSCSLRCTAAHSKRKHKQMWHKLCFVHICGAVHFKNVDCLVASPEIFWYNDISVVLIWIKPNINHPYNDLHELFVTAVQENRCQNKTSLLAQLLPWCWRNSSISASLVLTIGFADSTWLEQHNQRLNPSLARRV